jgi:hypothetical protein
MHILLLGGEGIFLCYQPQNLFFFHGQSYQIHQSGTADLKIVKPDMVVRISSRIPPNEFAAMPSGARWAMALQYNGKQSDHHSSLIMHCGSEPLQHSH